MRYFCLIVALTIAAASTGPASAHARDSYSDHLVFAIHGYLGSKAELASWTNELTNQAVPWIAPEIPGFGTGSNCGKFADRKLWRKWIDSYLLPYFKKNDDSATTQKKIHLVGFSMGALLIADFLQRHQKLLESSPPYSTSFFAPYLGLKFPALETIVDSLVASGMNEVDIRTNSDLSQLVTGVNSDTEALLETSDYCKRINLRTTQELFQLAREVMERITERSRPIRSKNWTFYWAASANDQTIDLESAHHFANIYFTAPLQYVIPAQYDMPHQILHPRFQKRFPRFKQWFTQWTEWVGLKMLRGP